MRRSLVRTGPTRRRPSHDNQRAGLPLTPSSRHLSSTYSAKTFGTQAEPVSTRAISGCVAATGDGAIPTALRWLASVPAEVAAASVTGTDLPSFG